MLASNSEGEGQSLYKGPENATWGLTEHRKAMTGKRDLKVPCFPLGKPRETFKQGCVVYVNARTLEWWLPGGPRPDRAGTREKVVLGSW